MQRRTILTVTSGSLRLRMILVPPPFTRYTHMQAGSLSVIAPAGSLAPAAQYEVQQCFSSYISLSNWSA